MMNSNLEDGEAIGSKWLSKAIETAQKKVEARNYDTRKQVVQYDDVMNDQRKVIYEQRGEIMESETVDDVVVDMRHDSLSAIIYSNCPLGSYPEQWNVAGLKEKIEDVFGITPPIDDWLEEDEVEQEIIEDRIKAQTDEMMDAKIAKNDPGNLAHGRKADLARASRLPLERTPRDAGCAAASDLDARDRSETAD